MQYDKVRHTHESHGEESVNPMVIRLTKRKACKLKVAESIKDENEEPEVSVIVL